MGNKRKENEMNEVKFMYNGIKINGKLIKGYWSYGSNNFYNKNIMAMFVAKLDWNYDPKLLREYFKVDNDTDIYTDYFDSDSINFYAGDKNLEEIKKAWQKQEIKLINRASWTQEEKEERIKKVMAA